MSIWLSADLSRAKTTTTQNLGAFAYAHARTRRMKRSTVISGTWLFQGKRKQVCARLLLVAV